jgi:hypothetical protein
VEPGHSCACRSKLKLSIPASALVAGPDSTTVIGEPGFTLRVTVTNQADKTHFAEIVVKHDKDNAAPAVVIAQGPATFTATTGKCAAGQLFAAAVASYWPCVVFGTSDCVFPPPRCLQAFACLQSLLHPASATTMRTFTTSGHATKMWLASLLVPHWAMHQGKPSLQPCMLHTCLASRTQQSLRCPYAPATCSLFLKGPLTGVTGAYSFTLKAWYAGNDKASADPASITLTAAATPLIAIVTGPNGDVPSSK